MLTLKKLAMRAFFILFFNFVLYNDATIIIPVKSQGNC